MKLPNIIEWIRDDGEETESDEYDDHVSHAVSVSADELRLETDAVERGNAWVKTMFISDWPDNAQPGVLDMITTYPSANVDVSIHASPRPQQQAVGQFENALRELQTEEQTKRETGDPSVSTTQRRMREHQEILTQVTEGSQSVFDVSMYLTIRAETRERVERVARRIKTELEKKQLTAKAIAHRQDDGMTSASPVAKDVLARDVPDVATPMLGRAVGSLFPFSATTILEESGILYGWHATTESPVMVDRYARPNGYNIFTAGIIGAGKSFSTKLHLLRHLAKERDTILIMIDPLEGFKELAEALDAERVVVGGQRGINPMEIRETPQRVIDEDGEVDPFNQRFSTVMSFLESFFRTVSDAGGGLEKHERAVLGEAVREAYRRKGITQDPSTHRNESPTITDVISILAEIDEDAAAFLSAAESDDAPEPTERYVDRWETAASDLRIAMRPFQSGQYQNLSGESDVDLHDAKVTYLDLQQGEGEREMGLMMQMLLDTVYQRAKNTDKKVILCIDEAHYMMQAGGDDQSGLDWLERLTRHSRHHDLSLHLVTQKASDFLVNETAKTIADNCSQKIIHRLPGLSDEHAEALGLSEREAEFVRRAKPGTRERGWSHALLDVQDGATIPIKVSALSAEAEIIDPPEESEADEDVAQEVSV